MTNLVLIHRRGPTDLAADFPQLAVWKTCLRQVAFASAGQRLHLHDGDELLEHEVACNFLLEVICGLQSPLLGETEVMGQFKRFLATTRDGNPEWQHIAQLGRNLLAHARALRQAHLTGTGSRSYGGLVRKYCRRQPVTILGAGQLVEQMMPLLAKNGPLTVVCRRPDKVRAMLAGWTSARVASFEDTLSGSRTAGGLVIAAPMSARAVALWMSGCGRRFDTLIDLRSDSARDRLADQPGVAPGIICRDLDELYREVESNSAFLAKRVDSARRDIASRVRHMQAAEPIGAVGRHALCA